MNVKISEKDKNRIRRLNEKKRNCVSASDMTELPVKHRRLRDKLDAYGCALIEYRLRDIKFSQEALMLATGRYDMIRERVKKW